MIKIPKDKDDCHCGGHLKQVEYCKLWAEEETCDTCHNNHATDGKCEGTTLHGICKRCGADYALED